MLVIPAIDIQGGRCVRLRQGRFSDETVFADHPEEMALRWYREGAQRLHVVDLDGARTGAAVNREAVRRIVAAVPLPVELGGGIRNLGVMEDYFACGVQYLILGTAALKDLDLVSGASERFPGRIILGIDVKEGRVSVEGWTEESSAIEPLGLARRFAGLPVSAVVYTDILRDGMRTGPNVGATRDFARQSGMPVIASGGIAGLGDVKDLAALASDGVIGMITGRALYDGKLSLAAAIRTAAGEAGQVSA